jgi:hypothetical protein
MAHARRVHSVGVVGAPVKFVKRYEKRTRGYEIHAQLSSDDEGSFSWYPCETCGADAGMRYDCVLTNPGGRVRIEVRSCPDCIAYAANGTIPEDE